MHIDLRMRLEGNAPISGEPTRQCSSTPVGFGQRFPSKEQRDNTGPSPILS